MNYSYDPQVSLMMDQANRTRPATQLNSSIIGDQTISSTMDPILNRVSMIENRLNTSDSIYRLAAQANSLKDKERREQIRQLSKNAQQLNANTDKITAKIREIPDLVNKCIDDEIAKIDQTQSIQNYLNESRQKFIEKLSNIETLITETNKKTSKSLKKLRTDIQLQQTAPVDDTQSEEIQAQITEMKRYQDNIASLIKTALQHNDQDYAKVANDLNTVWSQITKYD